MEGLGDIVGQPRDLSGKWLAARLGHQSTLARTRDLCRMAGDNKSEWHRGCAEAANRPGKEVPTVSSFDKNPRNKQQHCEERQHQDRRRNTPEKKHDRKPQRATPAHGARQTSRQQMAQPVEQCCGC